MKPMVFAKNNVIGPSKRWLSKPSIWAAWLGLALALFTPPAGIGLTLCWLKACTGIPCPGCGLSRSLSCAARGLFAQSWHFHPMGLLILILFLFIAMASLLPSHLRLRLARHIDSQPTIINALYYSFVAVFVAFGAIRALLHLGNTFFGPG